MTPDEILAYLKTEPSSVDEQMKKSAQEMAASESYAKALRELELKKARDWALLANQVVGAETI